MAAWLFWNRPADCLLLLMASVTTPSTKENPMPAINANQPPVFYGVHRVGQAAAPDARNAQSLLSVSNPGPHLRSERGMGEPVRQVSMGGVEAMMNRWPLLTAMAASSIGSLDFVHSPIAMPILGRSSGRSYIEELPQHDSANNIAVVDSRLLTVTGAFPEVLGDQMRVTSLRRLSSTESDAESTAVSCTGPHSKRNALEAASDDSLATQPRLS